MNKIIIFLLLIMTIGSLPAPGGENYNIDSLITSVEKSFARVNSYTCLMSQKELINNEYVEVNNTIYKFMKPDNYYMKYTEGPDKDMEVLYAGRKYDNKLLVHLGGLLNVKNFSIEPKSPRALKKNRHTILESDMGNMIRLFRTNFNKAVSAGEGSFSFEGEKKFSGRSALVFKARFPQSKGYYGKTIELYVDKTLNLPVKLTVWNWDDKLIEFYQLTNLKINPGLSAKDFDDNNPGYHF